MEAQFGKIKAEIKEIGGRVTSPEIKVERKLQPSVNLHNTMKMKRKKITL